MKTSTLTTAALLGGVIALAGCGRDQPVETTAEPAAPGALETPPAMTVEEPRAPEVEVTGIRLGTEVGEDEAVAADQDTFSADDHTIFATVITSSEAAMPASSNLAVRWSYGDGQLVDERSVALSLAGEDASTFHIVNGEGWPTGTYTLEVAIDGETMETREFTVE